MHFTKSIVLALLTPGIICASWLDIQPDLANATSEVEVFNTAVAALPSTGATAAQALASVPLPNLNVIYSDLIKLRNAYDVASKSINSTLLAIGLPSNTDATDGCAPLQVLGKSIASAVGALADKESAFVGASVGTSSLLKQALTTLEASVKTLNTLWLTIAPADFKQYPITITAQVEGAFDTVLAKF
ncbi:hypothetical protein C8J56DRAFT_1030032 [Mycena floridula]|nr:hypothetical protein C8J56DRAFT_1030032 [Mycena floridula]